MTQENLYCKTIYIYKVKKRSKKTLKLRYRSGDLSVRLFTGFSRKSLWLKLSFSIIDMNDLLSVYLFPLIFLTDYLFSLLFLFIPQKYWLFYSSVQFSSVAQSCPTLCDPINHSSPGLPVHHQLLEFTQTHVHWVRDAIQSPHSLPSPSPLASIFPSIRVFSNESALRISPSHQSTGVSASPSVLPVNTQDWSPLGWTGWISLQSKGLSRVFSNTTVQKHQFFSAQLSYSPTLTSIHDHWKNYSLD